LSRLVALSLALLLALFAGQARAHASRTVYLEVAEIGDGEAIASLRSDGALPITLRSPDCALEALPVTARAASVGTLTRVRCPGGLGGATLEIEGLRDGSDVVLARVSRAEGEGQGAVLTARSPRLVIPAPGGGRSVFQRYVRLGFEHVLSGLDHVLFLLALVWQAHAASRGALRPWALELARAATAFTLAHTLTLTATALGWLAVPAGLAEALIAVSLVLVALDVGRAAPPLRLGVVMAFGLVHGLGFAGALTESRLPEHAVALGLLGFNVGVELGQLALLAAAVAAISLLARSVALRARAATLSAYAIGATGAYLVLARSTFFFP
jgi:hypothetical protein